METIEETKDIKQIANLFYEFCIKGEFQRAQEELFADDAESIEPPDAQMQTVQGIEAHQGKG